MFQIEMMKNLRDVNVDNNMVGWYQSTYLGSFLSDPIFVDTQLNYQENLSEFVVIVYGRCSLLFIFVPCIEGHIC